MNQKISTLDFIKIPIKPGVYFFKDKDKTVIYVGKATSLRARIKQYFKPDLDAKTQKMISQARSLDFVQASSPLQAAIVEAKLIKQYEPKYNVLLKDDKRYLYLGITKDKYPRVKTVRRPELENLLFWAGPFTSSGTLKQILRWVRKAVPFCSCSSGRKKPCLYFQIGLCPGPGVIPVAEYQKNINQLIMFFSGKSEKLLKRMKNQMLAAAKQLKFEEANMIKKRLVVLEDLVFSSRRLKGEDLQINKGLEKLKQLLIKYQGIDPFFLQRIEAYDIANLSSKIIVASMVVLENGEPNQSQYRHFKITLDRQDDPLAMAQVLSRRLRHEEWLYPQLILIDGGVTQLSRVVPILREKKLFGSLALIGLTKQQETIVVPIIKNNRIDGVKKIRLPKSSPALKLLQTVRDESHRFAQRLLHARQRQEMFKK